VITGKRLDEKLLPWTPRLDTVIWRAFKPQDCISRQKDVGRSLPRQPTRSFPL